MLPLIPNRNQLDFQIKIEAFAGTGFRLRYLVLVFERIAKYATRNGTETFDVMQQITQHAVVVVVIEWLVS